MDACVAVTAVAEPLARTVAPSPTWLPADLHAEVALVLATMALSPCGEGGRNP
jgi:hypothetical protein